MSSTAYLADTLAQLGLSEKEVRVYLALLSLGSTTAYRIAEHCAVKKPTVYITLEELRKKGLVLKVPHAKKAVFAARDVSEYLEEQKNKLEAVSRIVPELQQLGAKLQPNVYFFRGFEGIKQAAQHKFEQMQGKTFHSFYSGLAGCEKEILDFYDEWDAQAVAAGIKFNILVQRPEQGYLHNVIKLSKNNKNIAIRYLENLTYPPQSIEIGEDFVRITSEKNYQTTIIDDIQTAQAMREIFKIVWETAAK